MSGPFTTSSITLLPCPFCGGPPVPFHKRVSGLALGEFTVSAYVFCHECGAQGENAEDWFEPGDSIAGLMRTACELWNGRDTRHGGLYEANAQDGNNVYPRQGDAEDRA